MRIWIFTDLIRIRSIDMPSLQTIKFNMLSSKFSLESEKSKWRELFLLKIYAIFVCQGTGHNSVEVVILQKSAKQIT